MDVIIFVLTASLTKDVNIHFEFDVLAQCGYMGFEPCRFTLGGLTGFGPSALEDFGLATSSWPTRCSMKSRRPGDPRRR
jgi:hypothetical protein